MPDATDKITLTACIVSVFVGNCTVAVADLPALIKATYAALNGIGAPEVVEAEAVNKPTTAQTSSRPKSAPASRTTGVSSSERATKLWTAR